jgi:GWxTD domain-containing protein
MRAHWARLIICVIFISVFAAPAFSQEEIAAGRAEVELAVDPLEWDKGPAGFLMTKKEKKEWKSITAAAAAEQFIELFWARRNPDPTQSFNPFKAQFDSRVRYADENFAYKGTRGALSDRGRILILLGPPHHAEHRSATETVTVMGLAGSAGSSGNRATDEVRGHADMWVYDPLRLPEKLNAKGNRLLFVFYEERAETNEYILDRSHPEATMGMRVISKAPEIYLLNPDLKQVPKPVSLPGARTASAEHLGWIGAGTAKYSEQAMSMLDLGLADAANRPVWLHLELPAEAPQLDLLAGQVLSAEGEVLSNFEIEAVPLARGAHKAYHLAFPLGPGDYRLEVVGAAAGQPQVEYASEVTVPTAPMEGAWMSPMWVGVEGSIQQDALLGSAYCFGQYHLIPLVQGSEVKRASELNFLGFMIRPGLNEAGGSSVEVEISLKKDGKRLGRPLVMPVNGVPVADDLHAYMNAVNLSALPETGQYTLGFKVTEPISDSAAEHELTINLVD